MAKTTVPPSSSDRGSRPRGSATDVRAWLGGIRLSGFMVIALGLVVLAALVLVPTFSTYVQQRQRIAALEEQIQLTSDQVDHLKAQRERWRDPAYITTQARERLFYVQPGEVVYLVNNDLDSAHRPTEQDPVSAEVTATRTDWMTQLFGSLVESGLSQTVTDPAP